MLTETPTPTPTPTSMPTAWASLHVYLDGGPDRLDECVTGAVVPAVRQLQQREPDAEWFFIRYWEGGPHVRLRVRAGDDGVAEVERAIEQWIATLGEREPRGEIAHVAYEPETARYGGPDGLVVSERFFGESSELAAAVVARTPDAAARTGIALELLVAFALGATRTTLEAVRLLRSYAMGLGFLGEGPPVDVSKLLRAAEAEFVARQPALEARSARLQAQLADPTSASTVAAWSARARELAGSYEQLQAEGRLVGEPARIVLSQLHMFHNRIGIALGEECYLAWLASMVLAGASPFEGHGGDGPDAPDRAYHEASKVVAARPWDVLKPGTLAGAGARWAAAWPTMPVALPAVSGGPVATTSLADVLRDRRSAYGTYSGRLDVADVAALLQHGAGVSRAVRFPLAPPGQQRFPLRSYPSSGARYPVRVGLVARAVDGLEAGTYAYAPSEHALHALGPAPAIDDLLRASNMFEEDPEQSRSVVDVAEAPAFLFLIGEFTYQREQYGIRAFRFVLQESGHLAQNLVLVATALGLATVTLGSFFDDYASQLVFADGVNHAVLYVLPLARTGPGIVTAADR
jgi:thiopeptide-type bacteriocin biosynthesis protein